MDDVHRPASARAYGTVDRTVGLQIGQALKLRDASLSHLAEQTQIPIEVLQACCAGQKRLPASSLCDVARVLRLPVSYFFTPLTRKQH
jgi:hypothetical protein